MLNHKKEEQDTTRWETDENTYIITQCVFCKHKSKLGAICDAYPLGIPEEIIKNKVDHTLPYEGDNGIQFEPIDD